MGSSGSRRKNPKTPIPNYSTGANRSVAPLNSSIGNSSPLNRDQQRELMVANQTIANLNNQLQALQRGGVGAQPMPYGGYPSPGAAPMPYGGYPSPGAPPMPYGGYPSPGMGIPPMPYGGYPTPGGTPPYGQQSPLLQRFGGQGPYPNQQQYMGGGGAYRDTDFAAVASISGLNPDEIAFLHREFMNLTRSGTAKMDRTIFRQLLRDILLEANNEHVDRAIENIFVSIDRNHDGFIDFPEFVGAFKDVLKGGQVDAENLFADQTYPDILTEQLRASGVGPRIAPQSIAYVQQPQPATQLVSTGGLSIVPLASTGVQQVPLAYGGAAPIQISDATPPLLTLDPNQSTYVIATPGQYLITQPTALQCVPLPVF